MSPSTPQTPSTASPALGEALERSMDFFKALANEQRLRILGLLASRPAVVEEIAGALELTPATVSHHLARLRRAGLIGVKSDQQYRVYWLEEKRLREASRELLRLDNLRAGAGPFPEDAYARKVLDTFLSRGRITAIPAQRKKRVVILDWLAAKFEAGRDYPEPEVNALIERFHSDYCFWRRELVMGKWMQREKGVYRLRSAPASGRGGA
ncbi:MAG: metalloregulator ArsR/SmtB family transcription factor [Candidatus Krumholzibacteriia bacterium]|nr:metalloregulator ArsR/SmtB family transcription factor [bacterium]MCB9513196.1 metalloregulator ArsR/SmtB family transcription factor [Candidatus Latescibacterota bacterium]MCB9514660.1 metalloregulator ArsR/SmtB family transcription factor [Candidatus Latescibacterota bacterium]